MGKNYELMYKTLIKMLKNDLYLAKEYDKKLSLGEKLENKATISFLEWLLNEYLPELEGKKWNNIFNTKEEFKGWKKKILL